MKTKCESLHFIGLGGIGMSALARVALQKGIRVEGSDVQSSALLEALQNEGAILKIGHRADNLTSPSAIVYTSAVKPENVEWLEGKRRSLPFLHRSELLDQLIGEQKSLLVTGTHGKTTTSTLLAAALKEGGFDPSFVLGGIHRQWNTNGGAGSGSYFVAEADESDGSFLKTHSFGAIVTNLEDEHLDYWKNGAALDLGFAQFFRQVKQPSHLFWCGDDERLRSLAPPGISYGFGADCELQIFTWEPTATGLLFTVGWNGRTYESIPLSLSGRHNALNGAAVFGLALSLGVEEALIRRAFQAFAGTKRRLEKKGDAAQVEVYDDYGHHPTEIRATLGALRSMIGRRRLVVVFQAHRYSRVRDLLEEFAQCFESADLVVMTEIYSAGEAPIPGITSALLHSKLKGALFSPRATLEEEVVKLLQPGDVVLTIGAGDVTRASDSILEKLKKG